MKKSFAEQFNNNSLAAKRDLAITLLRNARRESQSEKAIAAIKATTELAVDAGTLNVVVSSIDLMNERFNIDYWNEIQPAAFEVVSRFTDFEDISEDFEELIRRARQAEQFKFCAETTGRAQRQVKKTGDAKQNQMLRNLERDMKALTSLQKNYQQIKNDGGPKTKSDNLVFGKYLCYGKQDWEKGLPFLARGSDAAIAKTATIELESKGNDLTLVLREWISLGQKKKYKGLDQRCLLERVEERLNNERLPELDNQELRFSIRNQIQFVKKFVDDVKAGTRIVKFGNVMVGKMELGEVEFSHGQVLIISKGIQQVLHLPIRKTGVNYTTASSDRRLQFLIRFMNNGWVEMRTTDLATKRWSIWYGK